MAFLVRIQPEKRCWRWYSIRLQATLLEPLAVVCGWGSLRSRYARWRIIPCADRTEAERLAQRLLRSKLRRGYRFRGNG